MQRFSKAIRMAVDNQNWHAALTSALVMPDICGRMVEPKEKSGPRYARWFETWVMPARYTATFPRDRGYHVFLSGNDCYALRCSLLHQGEADISEQKARETLDNFQFILPPGNGNVIHCNQFDKRLQLQVDIFCTDIADGVDSWHASVERDAEVQQRLQKLLTIEHFKWGGSA